MNKYFKKGLAVLLSVLISISTAFAVPVSVSAIDETDELDKITEPLPIGNDAINYANGFENLEIVPCEQLGGIYFINGNAVSFFNTDTGTTELVTTISNESYSFADSFPLGDKLYILENNESDLASHSLITVYNLVTRSVEQTLSFENPAEVIGADDSGRIFLSHYDDDSKTGITYLLSPSGKILSSVSSMYKILYFVGLDSTNGNLYYVTYGFDITQNLCTGNYLRRRVVLDNQFGSIEYQSQFLFTCEDGVKQVQLMENKYVYIDDVNGFTYDESPNLKIFNSNTYDADTYTPNLILDKSINNRYCYTCWGVRAALFEEGNSIICLKNRTSIAEYDLSTDEELATENIPYPLFALLKYKNGVAAIEKDNNDNFYYEFFPVKTATYVQIEGKDSLEIGFSEQLTVKTDGTLSQEYKWESSNPDVASVNEQGEVHAWKEGSTTITLTAPRGLTANITINVTSMTTPESEEPKLFTKHFDDLIPFEKLGGIYCIDNRSIMLYSTVSGQLEYIYYVPFNYMDYYASGDRLYFLRQIDSDSDSSSEIIPYNLLTRSLEQAINFDGIADTIGVDASGRIYLAGQAENNVDSTYNIYLLSPSGELLSTVEGLYDIRSFVGFDSTNDNFYVKGYTKNTNWSYVYSDSNGCILGLMSGNVKNDTINFNESCIAPTGDVELLNNKYICIANYTEKYRYQLQILDSNSLDISDSSIRQGMCFERDEYVNNGAGVALCNNGNSIVMIKDKNTLAEYDLNTGEMLATGSLSYPVYKLINYKEDMAAIETGNGLSYYQYVRYKDSTEIKINGNSAVQMGTTEKYTITSDGTFTPNYTLNSSNPEIATINENGELYAWQEGSTEITATTTRGLTAKFTVTVIANSFDEPIGSVPIGTDVTKNALITASCEQLGGIYFIAKDKLTFYNTSSGEVCVLPSIFNDDYTYAGYFSCGDRLYILENKEDETENTSLISLFNLTTHCVEKTISFDKLVDSIAVDETERIYLVDNNTYKYKSILYLLSSTGEMLSMAETNRITSKISDFDTIKDRFYTVEYKNTAGLYMVDKIYYRQEYDIINNEITIGEACTELPIDYPLPSVLLKNSNIMVALNDSTTIAEYDVSTGERIAVFTASVPISLLVSYRGGVAAFSEGCYIDGEYSADNYSYEYFPLTPSTSIEINSDSAPIQIGSSKQLTASTDGELKYEYIWESSDPKVASVNDRGEVIAWKAGSAEITVSTLTGLTATYTVTVTGNPPVANPEENAVETTGQESDNASKNNYEVYGKVINSYLIENSDGTLTRVEYNGSSIIVENYSIDGKELISSKNIDMELELFGGYYSGAKYNFLVFGQTNADELSDREVMRVVKYSKDWTRIASISYNGINTQEPFAAGSLRMTETSGKLYVHTCHLMLKDLNGINHQANMTFVINEDDMTASQSFYWMWTENTGYVSHSFNQLIQTDGEYIYRVDQGDNLPRAITVNKCDIKGKITDTKYTYAINLNNVKGTGWYQNQVGASIGGFELSENECIIAGNVVDYTKPGTLYSEIRNIFVSITDKNMNNTDVVWLTNYSSGSEITVYTPQLIKIDSNRFLVMWEEYNNNTKDICTKMVTIDNSGNITSEIIKSAMRLSDCQPILCTDGLVRWYTGDDDSPVIYAVNPYDLDDAADHYLQGDTNCDGEVNLLDAVLAQKAALIISMPDEQGTVNSDINCDGRITLFDAIAIQRLVLKRIDL